MSENIEITTDEFRKITSEIEAEIGQVIVGQKDVVRLVLVGVLSGGHVLMEGVPGLGKTMLIRTFGQALKLMFSRVQFTPDLMPADITGTNIMEEGVDGRRAFRFQRGPLFSNLVLADEINRATPKTQSALLEAMQEKTVTVANQTYQLPLPFFVMATQNPLEMEGTYPLPEAQLDRFLFKVNVPFPSIEDLSGILSRTTGVEKPEAGVAADGDQIISMQKLARKIPIPSQVNNYVSRLIVGSHPGNSPAPMINQYVRYGASPRGGQALIIGSKIMALIAGRYNVSFDDVESIAPAALRHRLLLNFEGQAAGIQPDDVIADLIKHMKRDA